MEDRSYDLVVIGAGPGGYVAAICAARAGLKTAVVEREYPGGVCLNVGCIPSKSLISSATLIKRGREALEAAGAVVDMAPFDYAKVWARSRSAASRLSKGVEYLLKKAGAEYVAGKARLDGPRRVEVEGIGSLSAKAVIVATGSRPKALAGFDFDEKSILSSTGVLMSEDLPRSLAILGAGAIGVEIAYVMSAFGVETTLVEAMDRILPLEDAESAAVVARSLSKAGVSIRAGSLASRAPGVGGPIRLSLRSKDGAESAVEADRVLVAVGRTPNTDGLGLEEAGVRLERGLVAVGDWMESSASGIYAIGDIVGSPQLAHVASKEGEIAAARIVQVLKGGEEPSERRVDPLLIPSAVYCEPEVGSFGWSEERAKAAGIPVAAARFPYRGIGKAVAIDAVEGQAKVIYDPRTLAVLGASIVGEGATELVHELLLAARSELRIEDVADMIHAHPTLSEGIMEAARAALGRAVHA